MAEDWTFIYKVSSIQAISGLSEFFTFQTTWFVRPTQYIVTWAIHQIAFLNPLPYHLVSVALEFINACLLAFFTYRILKSYQQQTDNASLIAILVSVIFLFSWRHHETVFWYSSVNELLASLFRLSSLVLITFLVHETEKVKVALLSIIVLGLFNLSIFSKESAIVLPFELGLLLGLDYLALNRQKNRLASYTHI